jgi:effector-binding domain-containing protein
MTEIKIIQRDEQPTAAVRERVPVSELPQFFDRVYHQTMAALQAQGLHPTGPPFAKYYGVPTDSADVEAGFPASGPVTATDGVVAGTLPGGSVVEAMHVGPYDTMEKTYHEMVAWIAQKGLTPSDVMWETYLSDPQQEPDPATWRTQIFWPVRG